MGNLSLTNVSGLPVAHVGVKKNFSPTWATVAMWISRILDRNQSITY
jgi:hypothetical protein